MVLAHEIDVRFVGGEQKKTMTVRQQINELNRYIYQMVEEWPKEICKECKKETGGYNIQKETGLCFSGCWQREFRKQLSRESVG